MIDAREKQIFMDAGAELSANQWIIADTTLKVLDDLQDKHPMFAILNEISKLCGVGARRLLKLSVVASTFTPDERSEDWPFGYYERALDFGEEAHEAMEFLSWYAVEYMNIPTISTFGLLYTQHILGKSFENVTSNEYVVRGSPAPQEPDDFREYLGHLRMLARRRFTSDRADQILRLLDQIEALLVEVQNPQAGTQWHIVSPT